MYYCNFYTNQSVPHFLHIKYEKENLYFVYYPLFLLDCFQYDYFHNLFIYFSIQEPYYYHYTYLQHFRVYHYVDEI